MATDSMQRKIKRRDSFEDVLGNYDDQVIVRELLKQYIPLHVKEKIVDEFNAHADRYNSRVSNLG